jgi:hypothetical protein
MSLLTIMTSSIIVDMSKVAELQVQVMCALRLIMPRAVVLAGAVTCLLDGFTLLHAASVTTIITSAVDADKDDGLPSTKKVIE